MNFVKVGRSSIKLITKSGYDVELAIPKNINTGLIPKENSKIGLRFEFNCIGRDGKLWGTTFERWSFVDIILGTKPFVWIDHSFVSRARCDVGSVQTVGFHAVYDNGSSVTDGEIYINGMACPNNGTGWSMLNYSSLNVGKISFTVTDVKVCTHTEFKQVIPNIAIIFDRININSFRVKDSRIKVDDEASFSVFGIYEYDNTAWSGTCTLNDTTTKNSIGKFGYKVSSVTDNRYGLTTFRQSASDLYVIFDKIFINLQIEMPTVVYGEVVKFTAFFHDAEDNPIMSQMIEFFLNENKIGSVITNSSGKACYAVTNLDAGTYSVQAVFQGSENYRNSSSEFCTLIVQEMKTKIVIYHAEFKMGEEVEISATLRDLKGSALLGQMINFYLDDVPIGSSVSNQDGVALIKWIPKKAGRNFLKAEFLGSVNYEPSSSTEYIEIIESFQILLITVAVLYVMALGAIIYLKAKRKNA